MKKQRGLGKVLKPLSRDELETMSSGALLTRLKRLRQCDESSERSDLSEEEIRSASQMILFKSDPAWRTAYAELKAILAGRDHVTNKP